MQCDIGSLGSEQAFIIDPHWGLRIYFSDLGSLNFVYDDSQFGGGTIYSDSDLAFKVLQTEDQHQKHITPTPPVNSIHINWKQKVGQVVAED